MQEFHVISLDSFTAIGGSDVEGRLAVFGDAAISNYSVSYVVPPPTSTFYIDRSGNAIPANFGAHVCIFIAFLVWHGPVVTQLFFLCTRDRIPAPQYLEKQEGDGEGGWELGVYVYAWCFCV